MPSQQFSPENLGADRTCLILDKALSWAARNYAGWDLYQYLRETRHEQRGDPRWV